MSIGITWLDSGYGREQITLSHDEFNQLSLYFKDFEQKVGLVIDGYSDIRLSPTHISLLLEIVDEEIPVLCKKENFLKFFKMLERAVIDSQWLLITGD